MDTPTPEDQTIATLDRILKQQQGGFVSRAGRYISAWVQDGIGNLLTGLRVKGIDKSGGARVAPPRAVSEVDARNLYRGCGTAARVVDLPAQDMTRAGFDIEIRPSTEGGKGLSPQESKDAAEEIQDDLEQLGAMVELKRALRWEAQYGGSLILIGLDDGKDLAEPATPGADVIFLRATHRHRVTVGPIENDVADKRFGQPQFYNLTLPDGAADLRVHHSRVLEFLGLVDIDDDTKRDENDGWSDSIYTRLWDPLREFEEAYGYAAVMTQDFAQASWKVKGLAKMLKAGQESKIQARAQFMDQIASILNARLLDADGESWERQSTNLGSYPDLLDRFGIRFSAAAGIPMTLLFGQTPGGFSKEDVTGEANWDDVIKGWQEERVVPQWNKLTLMLFQSRGVVPERYKVIPRALTQLDEAATAELRKTVAETDALNIQNEIVTPEEVSMSRFGGAEYSMETTLDLEAREEAAEAEKAAEEKRRNAPPPPPLPAAPVPPALPEPPTPPPEPNGDDPPPPEE